MALLFIQDFTDYELEQKIYEVREERDLKLLQKLLKERNRRNKEL